MIVLAKGVTLQGVRLLSERQMGVLLSKMNTQEGKIDFHSLQTSCVTLAVESGANAKEAQVLARRSAPQFTMSVYAYARNKRLAEVTEMMGEKVLAGQMCVTGVSQACHRRVKHLAGRHHPKTQTAISK